MIRLVYLYLRALFYAKKSRLLSEKVISHILSRKNSDTAYLIATGPSIKQQNLDLLDGKDCYTFSNAYLHSSINKINPILHGFASYHAPLIEKEFFDWVADANIKLPNKTGILTTTHNSRFFANGFEGRSIFFVLFFGALQLRRPSILPRYVFPAPLSGPLLLLPYLIESGYKRICLIGCDHDVLKSYGAPIENFYDSKVDIRSNATSKEFWTDLRVELRSTIKLWDQYDFYKAIAKEKNIRIYNLSPTSWLHHFEKLDFYQEFGHADKSHT